MMERSLAEPTVRPGAQGRFLVSAALLGAALAGALALVSGPARGQSAATAAADDPLYARVDGRPVLRSEIELRRQRGMAAYVRETGREVPPAFVTFFQRTALEDAVRERLIAKDGRARGIKVSDAAADSVLRQGDLFRVDGRFDPARFAAYKKENPQSYLRVREEAKDFVTFQRRARELERELAPDAATLDALVARRTGKVAVRSALVSETQFDGLTDPSDEELRAYYAKNRASFNPPGRVALTTLTFHGLDQGRPTERALARARNAAEALLAEVMDGVPFDSAGVRPDVHPARETWGQGQEQGVFGEEPAWAESAYASPAGRVLPRIFANGDGFSLVRIDRSVPRGTPSLAVVADDVRARWRAEATAARDRAEARRFYDAHPDSFHTPTTTVRWALVDQARLPVPEPKEAELRAWFTARQSEFTRLDPAGGGVRRLTFEEARADARERFTAERRVVEARRLADEAASAWSKGKSGPRSSPAVTVGGPFSMLPTGDPPAGLRADLADSARSWPTGPRALVVEDEKGFAVVGLVRQGAGERAAFDVVEPRVLEVVQAERLVAERAAARAWFEQHRDRYMTGPRYAVTSIHVRPPAGARVDVPGPEIERYYRSHLSEFSTPVEVRVRHILFTSGARGRTAAIQMAKETRSRILRGENFAQLARTLSEDPGSRNEGGDLGFLHRGSTVSAFDEAAFALTPAAPLSQPVETSFGIHLLQLVERKGGEVQPFDAVRGAIVPKLVQAYADSSARRTAERFFADIKNREDLIRVAEERGLNGMLLRWYDGAELVGPAVLDQLRADAALVERGGLLPRIYKYEKLGYVVAALDSVGRSEPLTFEQAGPRVLADYRRELRLAAADARAARIEKELAAGRPWTEATETVGGTIEPVTLGFGEAVPGFAALPAIDSLLFGPAQMKAGTIRRVSTPRGTLLLSLVERVPPDPAALARERESVRRTVLNRRIYDYVETLRERAKIEVLRRELADRPPAPPGL